MLRTLTVDRTSTVSVLPAIFGFAQTLRSSNQKTKQKTLGTFLKNQVIWLFCLSEPSISAVKGEKGYWCTEFGQKDVRFGERRRASAYQPRTSRRVRRCVALQFAAAGREAAPGAQIAARSAAFGPHAWRGMMATRCRFRWVNIMLC